jgi:tetratricopeptide (TPR) repeat protein
VPQQAPAPSTQSSLAAVKAGRSPALPVALALLVIAGAVGGAWAAGLFGGKPQPAPAQAAAPSAPPAPVPVAAAPPAPAPAPVAAPSTPPAAAANPSAFPPGSPGYLTEMGKQAFARGEFDVAIESCRKALALDGKWVEALKVMGTAYQAKGDPYRAVKAFKEYVRIAPYASDADGVQKLIASMGG